MTKYLYIIFQNFPVVNHLREMITANPNDLVGLTSTTYLLYVYIVKRKVSYGFQMTEKNNFL